MKKGGMEKLSITLAFYTSFLAVMLGIFLISTHNFNATIFIPVFIAGYVLVASTKKLYILHQREG